MNFYDVLLAKMLNGDSGGGGDGDTNLAELEIYIADFLSSPPTITDGALNGYTRQIVA